MSVSTDAHTDRTTEPVHRLRVLDPADSATVVTEVAVTDHAEVTHVVALARRASRDWAATPAADRGTALRAAADAVAAATDELALLTTREMGKPLAEATGGVSAGIGTLRQYAEAGPLHRGRSLCGEPGCVDTMRHEPRGVVAVITPWNDPVAVPCGLLGAALVTGNTVVFKPSERTPGTGARLAALLAAHLPDGVLTVVQGDAAVGERLAGEAVDVVAHVGSTAAGHRIRRLAAETGAAVLLENGGSDALVVDDDVEVGWAADQAALGCFANAGQICTSVERVYLHRAVAEPFLAALVERAGALPTGPGTAAGTRLGPLVDRRHRESVHESVRDAVARGARLLCGGVVPTGPGAFYPATVVRDCTERMAVLRDETFGPVAAVALVDDFDEGLRRAAASRYGLAATVLTGRMAHAARACDELPVGTVKVNAVFGGAPGGAAHPRGGSGQGYGYGPELLDEMTTTKVTHLRPPPA